MKKAIFLIVSAVIILSVITQCNKKKENLTPASTTSNSTNTELLAGTSSKSYKISKVMSSGIDLTSQVTTCQKNWLFKFYTNGNFYVLSGTPKCNATDPDTLTATTWKFNTAQDSIIWGKTIAYGFNSAKLNSLSSTSFTISSTIPSLGGVTGQVTFNAQ